MKAFRALVFMPLLLSCALLRPGDTDIADYLPRETDVPGWRTYKKFRLTGDGIEKNSPLSGYKALEAATAEYRSSEGEKIILVSILRFRMPVDAYGFISLQNSDGISENKWSDDLILSDRFALQRLGNYVVYVRSEKNLHFLRQELRQFLSVSFSYMKNNVKDMPLPESLNILRESDDNNIIYWAENFDELPAINRVMSSRWGKKDDAAVVFASDRRTVLDSFSLFKKIVEKDNYIILNSDDVNTVFRKRADGKYILITVYGPWIAGCICQEDLKKAEQIMGKVRVKLSLFMRKSH